MTCGPQRGPASVARIQAQVKQATRELHTVEVGSIKRKFALIAEQNEKLRKEVAAWRFRHDDEQYSPRHDQIVHKKNPIAEAMQDDGIG